jgi:hypothetical protein
MLGIPFSMREGNRRENKAKRAARNFRAHTNTIRFKEEEDQACIMMRADKGIP